MAERQAGSEPAGGVSPIAHENGPLAGVHMFEALPAAAVAMLTSHLKRLVVPAGHLVVAEGDEGDDYYVIASGEAEVSESKAGTTSTFSAEDQKVVARLGPGDGFGEMALLHGGRRQATVRAVSNLELHVLDGEAFRQTLNANRGLAIAIEADMALRATADYLGRSSPFASLDSDALRSVAARLQRVEFRTQAEIIHEGDAGDAFYLIVKGEAEVFTGTGPGKRQLAKLGPGMPFGEQALLAEGTRTASVRALGALEALRLARQDFLDALALHEELRDYLVRLSLRRERPKRIEGWQMEHRAGRGGDDVYVLKNLGTRSYLLLSVQSAFLWNLMDGEHTVRDLALAYVGRFGGIGVDSVIKTMLDLRSAGFIRLQSVGAGSENPAAAKPSWWKRVNSSLLAAVSHEFSLPDPDHLLTILYRPLAWIYSTPAQAACAVLAGSGLAIFVFRLLLPGPPAADGLLAVATIAAYAVQPPLHELGHALTTKHFGREVHRAGGGWYLLLPMVFVDTSDIWLSPKRHRLGVTWAGPYTNLILSGSAMTASLFFADSALRDGLLQFAAFGYLIVVLNLNPLVELDGYYLTMDWLEIPNLRGKALAYWGCLLSRRPATAANAGLRRIYLIYGGLALAYVVVLIAVVLRVYDRYLQALLVRLVPGQVAAGLGWLLGLIIAYLLLRRTWLELGIRRASVASWC